MTSSKGLLISLFDPVVFPVEAANTGRRRTLKHIPGAALLGAAARAYAAFGDLAFDAFHSGALRFGDGLPVNDADEIGWPAPFSLHRPKGGGAFSNHAWRTAAPEDPQWEQERASAFTLGGEVLKIKTTASLKTAIDSGTRRAAQAQLFGYEALAPGQRFYAEISAEDPALLEKLRAHLPEGRIRLGRSRSAEYGRAELRWMEAQPLPPRKSVSGEFLLWAVSDLALDPEEPDLAKMLGLEGAKLDEGRSFIRMRRVWPYNAHWSGRGLERLLIERGSTLVFKGEAPEADEIRGGPHQELGCGRLLVDPAFLAVKEPAFRAQPLEALQAPAASAAAAEGGPIFKLLTKRAGRLQAVQSKGEAIRAAVDDLMGFYAAAARLAGLETYEAGPSPAQWGAVRAAAARAAPKAKDVFGEKAPVKPEDADWGLRRWNDRKKAYESFRDWLADQAEADPKALEAPLKAPERLALLAKRAAERLGALRERRP